MTVWCFLDTECIGLHPNAPVWEFAGIRRSPNGQEERVELFIKHDPNRFIGDLPESFRADYEARYDPGLAYEPAAAAGVIHSMTSGQARIVGSNPSFDMERLEKLLRRNAITPDWHYHPTDIASLAAGFLAGKALHGDHAAAAALNDLPWKSDKLADAIGVDPGDYNRHTALGDVLWTRAQWDVILGGAA